MKRAIRILAVVILGMPGMAWASGTTFTSLVNDPSVVYTQNYDFNAVNNYVDMMSAQAIYSSQTFSASTLYDGAISM